MQAIRRAQNGLAVALTAALVWGASAGSAAAQQGVTAALDLAPKDAPMVFIIPSLKGLSDKFAQFNDNVGLGIPQLADMLGAIKSEAGFKGGLNDNGPMMFVIPSVAALEEAEETGKAPFLIVLPVSDYGEFTRGFQGVDEGGITKLTMPGNDEGYARQVGGFAVLAETKDKVMAYQPGNASKAIIASAGELGGKYLTGSDAAAYINVAALAPMARPLLKEAYAEMEREMEAEDDLIDPAMMNMAKSIVSLYFDAIDAVLRDATGAVMAGDLSDLGIGLTYAAQFKAGSPTAKVFPGGGDAAGALAKLPNQPYLFAQAFDMKGLNISHLVDSMMKAIPEGQDNWFVDMIRQSVPLMKQMKSGAQVYFVPAQAFGAPGGLFQGLTVIEAENADAYIKGFRSYMDAMGKMKMPLGPALGDGGPGGAAAPAMTFQTSYTPNAAEVEGVSVDRYEMQTVFPPELMAQMGPAALMMNMFGLGKTTGHVAKVDNHVIVTTTPNIAVVGQGVTALKKGAGLGADDIITRVRKEGLPPNPAAEMYVSVGGLASMINNFMMVFAPGMPAVQVPKNLPPVAVGVSVANGGAAGRVYVPVPVITFVKNAAMQMQAGPQRRPGRPRLN